MVVALSTLHGQTHPHGRRGLDAVDDVFDAILFVNCSTLVGGAVVAIEASGNELTRSSIGNQVARQLIDGELVKGHV